MDYGTIISGICEARYSTIEEVLADARLVAENCEKYSSVTMKITAEEVRRTDPLTMEAWALYHRFQEEISSRVPTKVLEVEPNEDIDENELPPEIPKLKVSKSKRGSSLGTVEEPKEKKAVSKKNLKSQVKVENGESSQTSSPAPPKKSKVNINVKDRYLWCLSELKAHHLKNDIGVDVQTCWPFNLAVDPIQYPTYLVVISNPMDLSMMEKKVKGEKYPQLISILRDMELIRDNAHTFNPGIV